MRIISCLALSLLFGLPLLAQRSPDDVQPNEDSVAVNKAAEQYAKAIAKDRTAQYAKVFYHALTGARIPLVTEPPRSQRTTLPASVRPGPEYRGIFEDPRFFLNLADTDRRRKIFGGEPAPPGSYPDVVAVLGNGRICSGTLVAPNVVLTAAHCHHDGVTETVVFGNNAFATDPKPRTIVVERSVALASSEDLSKGDVALLFLKESVTDVVPRRLARPEWIAAAKTVRAVGFGQTHVPSLGIKNVVDIPVASTDCAGFVASGEQKIPDTDYYFCGKGLEMVAGAIGVDKDTCGGDSGGPAFLEAPGGEWYLAAATSRMIEWAPELSTRQCGDGGIYARVDTVAEWAREQGVMLAIAPAPPPPLTPISATEGGLIGRHATIASSSLGVPLSQPTLSLDQNEKRGRSPGVASGQEVEGTISVDTGGDSFLILSAAPDARIQVTNLPDAFSIRDLPVTVRIGSNTDAGVHLEEIELAASAEFADKKKLLPAANFPRMTAAIDEVKKAFKEAVRTPGFAAQQKLADALENAETATATALESVTVSTAPVLDVYHEIRRVRKALYKRDDRYPPLAYDRIFRNTRGTVGIARRDGGKPFCSGVLISPRFVMTNRHCTEREPSSQVEVRFNYELSLTDTALSVDHYGVAGYQFVGGRTLDVAFLELDRDAIEPRYPDPKPWPQQCLSVSRVSLETPVYVVGHPLGGFRTVADNAFALFPFEATQAEYTRLRALVRDTYASRGADIQMVMLKRFDAAYEPVVANESEKIYRYYSPEYQSPDREPFIGLDSDTSDGNSGSAVFSRRSHRVVGLFVAGEEEMHFPQAEWAFHEVAIPMSELIRQLEEQHPNWSGTVLPCIDGIRYGAPEDKRNCSDLCDG